MLTMVQELNSRMLEAVVKQEHKPVLVVVYAPWCPRCAMMADTVEKFAAENEGHIRVYRIDEKDALFLVKRYGVDRVPTFLAFHRGKMTGMATGMVSKDVLGDMFRENDVEI